jgi:hypothetical protein
MTDHYLFCQTELDTQLRTLTSYFPKDKVWQVGNDDTAPQRGGDYFAIYRPAAFSQAMKSQYVRSEWHTTLTLYVRYKEIKDAWSRFETFRAAILELRYTRTLHNHGIYDQVFSSNGEPGYLVDAADNYLGFITQSLDVKILQELRITMNI